MVDNRDNYSASLASLDRELRRLRSWQVAGVTVVAIHVFPLIINAFTNRLSDRTILQCVTVICAGTFSIWVNRLGSKKLLYIIQSVEMKPMQEYLVLILKSLQYTVVREAAIHRLSKLIPELSRNQAESVSPELWKKLYKLLAQSKSYDKRLILELSLLIRDQQAIPYLKRALQHGDISAELGEQIREGVAVLKHHT